MHKHITLSLSLFLFAATLVQAQPYAQPQALSSGWQLQSSSEVGADGAAISSSSYSPAGWHRAAVPGTVVGALVEDGTYEDPFFGMNLRKLPGMTYDVGRNFIRQPMDPASPFARPWWYRTTFDLPDSYRGKHVRLHFDGINYRANVWLNGHLIADSTDVVGAYRRYEFDVTDAVSWSSENVLAVELVAPRPEDLAITWVDWNPTPPDKMMGLWRDVSLSASGPVLVHYPHVVSEVSTGARTTADLTVGALLRNVTDGEVTGTLRGAIGESTFERRVTLAAHDSAYVQFTPADVPGLHVEDPELWWPRELGEPVLHTLSTEFVTDEGVSDRQDIRFGIRQITSEFTPGGSRLFRVNGKRILIRGAGWSPDLFLRPQPDRQLAQLRYALDLNLNTIRLEGKLEDPLFWQRTDSLGLLVMAGWVCCSAWERWRGWAPEQYAVAEASLRDQARRLRHHASALVWFYGSDGPPPADVEEMYLDVLREEHWPNPSVSSASAKPADFSGPSGVKMTGPYDWVPPSYWLQDTERGGGWGYNTETSAGAAVPPIESMRRMLPEEDLWPKDSVWIFHDAGGQFSDNPLFDQALSASYGEPAGPADYTFKAQLMTYEGERAMFEAYRRNKYTSTGLIQWMFNNAWPSTYWHLFDWYLLPAGGYFGAKKANEPVHVMYSYDDASVAVVSALREPLEQVHLQARVFDTDMEQTYAYETDLTVPADSTIRPARIPEPAEQTGEEPQTYFVDLRLTDADGRALSSNFYWLSTHPYMLDEDNSTWYTTPVTQYADYSGLHTLPATDVTSTVQFSRDGDEGRAEVTLTNTGSTLAFFLRLQVLAGADGDEVVPVRWSDNYVTLLPGEERHLTATYPADGLQGAPPVFVVSGWNVARRAGAR